MWESGYIKENGKVYFWEAKVYKEPSEFGINGGKISKLSIYDETTKNHVVSYQRGWDIMPKDRDAQAVLAIVLEKFK